MDFGSWLFLSPELRWKMIFGLACIRRVAHLRVPHKGTIFTTKKERPTNLEPSL